MKVEEGRLFEVLDQYWQVDYTYASGSIGCPLFSNREDAKLFCRKVWADDVIVCLCHPVVVEEGRGEEFQQLLRFLNYDGNFYDKSVEEAIEYFGFGVVKRWLDYLEGSLFLPAKCHSSRDIISTKESLLKGWVK